MSSVHKLYEYDYKTGVIRAKNRKCPRCDSYMAFHSKPRPRWHCGKCNYVEYVTQ
ncbi:MAG: 30S ribosomal protein S27ae [Desulfurococcaceae archaeon]|uniref:Small ribosomal subunit protein eS31 n=1 Tax=Staphylothermus marinus TaxID=2280 RepID=A0A7C4JM83_STAMA